MQKNILIKKNIIILCVMCILMTHKMNYGQIDSPKWITYNAENSVLPSNWIYKVYFGHDKRIYIGSHGGLTIINGNKWKTYRQDELGGLWGHEWIKDIVQDIKTDRLFLGLTTNDASYGGGILKQTESGWVQIIEIPPAGTDARSVQFMHQLSDGRIWVGYKPYSRFYFGGCQGIVEIDGDLIKNITSDIGIRSNSYTSSLQTDHAIWVSAQKMYNGGLPWEGGVAKFENNQWTVYDNNTSNINTISAHSIKNDSYGNIWVGTENGLRKFNGETWLTIDQSNSEIPIDYIATICIDSSDNIWFGCSGGDHGLFKYDGMQFTAYRSENSALPSNNIHNLEIDKKENLWISTDQGIAVFNENGVQLDTSSVSDIEETNKIPIINYPNPFHATTTIEYVVMKDDFVRLEIFDNLGHKIQAPINQFQIAGNYTVVFNGGRYPSGLYFCKRSTGDYCDIIKMLLVK
jgi:hypothetical protein